MVSGLVSLFRGHLSVLILPGLDKPFSGEVDLRVSVSQSQQLALILVLFALVCIVISTKQLDTKAGACVIWAVYCTGDFPGGTSGKEPSCKWRRCRRHEFFPCTGKIPGGGNGNPLRYSCLENPMDSGAWRAIAVGSQRVRHDWMIECTARSIDSSPQR